MFIEEEISMNDEELTAHIDDNTRAIYQELCNSYRAIDSFRAQLLGFLPIVSGAGIFLLLSDAITDPDKWLFAKSFLDEIGYFGITITIALYLFELYGIKKCHCLIELGKDIETIRFELDGQFSTRPHGIVAGIINEPFAAGIIYPSVGCLDLSSNSRSFVRAEYSGGSSPALRW